MRKIICGLAIVIGIAIIGTGIFLQLNTEEDKETEKKEQEIKFERLNTFNKEEVCSSYKPVSTFLNTSDFTKISFTYPDCVHEYDLSYWYKMLSNEDGSIKINVSKDDDTLNGYMNSVKTKIIADKNNDLYQNLTYTEIGEITTENGIEVKFIEANYENSFTYTKTTHDDWYIAAKINEETILTYEINVKNKVLSYSAIEELINNIKIEKDAATFINSKVEGDYQVGTIRQNKEDSYEHGYMINYKVSTKYPEVNSFGSNYYESTFEFEDIYGKFYSNIGIEKDNFYDTFLEEVEQDRRISISNYNENTDTYRNINDSGLIKKNINGKEVYYFIYKYDYYSDNKKTSSGCLSEVYYEIAPHFYYKVYISTRDIDVNEAVISEFLNFTVEEY